MFPDDQEPGGQVFKYPGPGKSIQERSTDKSPAQESPETQRTLVLYSFKNLLIGIPCCQENPTVSMKL